MMFVSKLTWQVYKRFAARPFGELDRFQSLNPTEQRLEIARRLLAQVKHFASRGDALPEWIEAATVRNPEDLWAIWPSLPIVSKSMLNTSFEPVEMQCRFKLKGRIDSTGGSTGEPTRFFLDDAMLRASRGVHLYTRLKMGWRPGMPTIIVWGSERDIGRQSKPLHRVAHALYGDCLIPGFKIDDASVSRIIAMLRRESPVAMYGYSSLLEYIAERTLASGEQVQPKSVAVAWNGGEMLFENQVELFKRAFDFIRKTIFPLRHIPVE